MARIVVTGAAGFIASHVAERLLAGGHTVVGIDNFDPFYSAAAKRANLRRARGSDRFIFHEGDLTDSSTVAAVFEGAAPDVVVHLAAKAGVRPSIEDPVAYVRANLVATAMLLEAAHRAGVRRFVFGSSSSVYGNASQVPFSEDDAAVRPISPYAATKRAGELLCHAHQHLYGGSMICLRFFTVYGPRQRPDLAIRKFCALLAKGEPIPMFGDGSTERDYTWIDDIVDGVVAAVDRGSRVAEEFEIINLGESRTTRLSDLIALIGDAMGIEPEIQRLPLQPGDVVRTCADVTKAGRLLGYRPSTPIEEGIARFAQWFRGEQAGLTLR